MAQDTSFIGISATGGRNRWYDVHTHVPAPFALQMVASAAGIGPYGTQSRETASVAAATYRDTAQRMLNARQSGGAV